MKDIKLTIPEYFCPKCGQFRNTNQTNRAIHTCIDYNLDENNQWYESRYTGLNRTCILCDTRVKHTTDLLGEVLSDLIIDKFTYRPENRRLPF